jgi:DNA mismatch repair ATPase MutL
VEELFIGNMENVFEIILSEIKKFLNEDDYRGEHSAPSSEDSPMYDLSNTYPDDIYSNDAARRYKHYGDSRDNQAIHIIQSARNKPNKQIKIFRAVPDINFNIKSKLKPLYDIIKYYNKWKFFPLKNQIVYSLEDKYGNLEYDEMQKQIINDIQTQIQALESQTNKGLGINNGDWVTISRDYAKEHGDGNLKNYKIISKTVSARNLYTDGNDIFEWGYYKN